MNKSTECSLGRPRDAQAERRILEATLRLLAEEGYVRMTLDSVAASSGASKTTIYRRWSSKADVVTAALRTLQLSEPPVDTGAVPGDLAAILVNFRRSLLRPNGMALVGTVLAEEAHTPDLLRLFRERIVAPRRASLRAVLDRARKAGQLRRGARIDAAVAMLIGAVYARYLASGEVPASFPRELVEIVWAGIKAQDPAPPR
ncbi:MAG: TetR/AcrR family transcriptional regulator [Bryobacteraceae bacterium]